MRTIGILLLAIAAVLEASPAGEIQPREHGQEATDAGLNPGVLAKLDFALQQAVTSQQVAGVIGLIHHDGHRGYFEAFGGRTSKPGS